MRANHEVNMGWDRRNVGKNSGRKEDALIWKGSVDRKEFEVICRRVIYPPILLTIKLMVTQAS